MRQSGSGIAWQGFSQVRLSHLTCHPASVTLSSQFNLMRHVRSAGLMASMHREDPARQAVLPTAPFPARGLDDRAIRSAPPWDTARRTGRSVNAYALRQPDYLARGMGDLARRGPSRATSFNTWLRSHRLGTDDAGEANRATARVPADVSSRDTEGTRRWRVDR